MRFFVRKLFYALCLGLALAGSASAAGAQQQQANGTDLVFVQSNEPTGNQVLAFQRASDGSLTLAATYDTGGNGGRVEGATADPLASQGSLILDRKHGLLIGVNAGSNTVYSFQIDHGRLTNRDVVDSGGSFPASLGLHDNLLYVLNAKEQGSVHGYRIAGGKLQPIAHSTRSLGLAPPAGPMAFVMTPGQVGFSPSGAQLIVTTKANGSNIDVFGVQANGRLTDTPVKNASQTPVPFAFTFTPDGTLAVGEAATSSVSTYALEQDGSVSPIATQTDGKVALCWVIRDGQTYFVSDTGSGTESAFRIDGSGKPALIGSTPVGSGPTDQTTASGGSLLYVQLGNDHTIGIFKVSDGTLTSLGSVPGTPDMEGIVALN
jgi:6-phosphogluconolactonase (cycloisomerase 2 family)